MSLVILGNIWSDLVRDCSHSFMLTGYAWYYAVRPNATWWDRKDSLGSTKVPFVAF